MFDVVQRLAGLERDGVCDVEHGLSTAGFWAREHGLPDGECRRRVRVARKADTHFGVVLTALGDGRISWRHAQVIADAANPRILELVVGLQSELIGLADGMRLDPWEAEVRPIACRLDLDGGNHPGTDRKDSLRVSPTFDGMHHLEGWFGGDTGLPIHTAIEHLADELFHQAVRDRNACPDLDIPSRSELRAAALAEVCRRGLARDLSDSRPPVPEVTLVLDDTTITTTNGDPVDDRPITALSHDPMWRFLELDTRGAILELSRTRRLVTTELRRALTIRDGGCVFPGCGAPPNWCDAHHVIAWEHGGTTDPHNPTRSQSDLCAGRALRTGRRSTRARRGNQLPLVGAGVGGSSWWAESIPEYTRNRSPGSGADGHEALMAARGAPGDASTCIAGRTA